MQFNLCNFSALCNLHHKEIAAIKNCKNKKLSYVPYIIHKISVFEQDFLRNYLVLRAQIFKDHAKTKFTYKKMYKIKK